MRFYGVLLHIAGLLGLIWASVNAWHGEALLASAIVATVAAALFVTGALILMAEDFFGELKKLRGIGPAPQVAKEAPTRREAPAPPPLGAPEQRDWPR